MKSKSKATLTGAIIGFSTSLIAEIIRYSIGQRDMSDLGWAVAMVLYFTVIGAVIATGAYTAKIGVYSRRRNLESHAHNSTASAKEEQEN